jgi:hypothetical protein
MEDMIYGAKRLFGYKQITGFTKFLFGNGRS